MIKSNQPKQYSILKIFPDVRFTPVSRFTTLMLLCALTFLTACAGPSGVTLEPTAASVIIPRHESAPLTNASLAYVQGDFARVMSEMYRTCLGTHWSMMSLDREPADKRQVNPSVPELVITTALMPNGLRSEIYCWPAGDGRIAVAVRAGPFGNVAKEKMFIQTLAENLHKAPVPDRSRTFDMPSLEQYQNAHEPRYE